MAYTSVATLTGAVGGYFYLNSGPSYPVPTVQTRRPPPPWTPPSRQHMLNALKSSSSKPPQTATANQDANEDQQFDLLIVGGGATGAGVAVDAVTRGLKVALVERDDFSSGVSFVFPAARTGFAVITAAELLRFCGVQSATETLCLKGEFEPWST